MAQFGISAALLTPFRADGRPNNEMLAKHATRVLAEGAHGITLFGTTGEGASIGLGERRAGLDSLKAAGIDPDQITLGLCGTAIKDVAAQIAQGLDCGVTKVLAPPPFYFANADDDGLFAWYAALFENAGKAAKFILYHIPQVTGVPLSLDLLARLKDSFPDRIMAIKDSSGDWENAQALLKTGTIDVLVGDERLLHRALPLGAVGSICGMANLYPARMRAIFDTHKEDKKLSAEVDLILSHPVMPALKALLARATEKPDWAHVRPPLSPLSPTQHQDLLAQSNGAADEFSWAQDP